MKKPRPAIILGILLVGTIGYLAGVTDQYTEINTMTGSVRTKMRYAYVFNTPWKVGSNWVEESAARQGISTEGSWRQLSVLSMRLMIRIRACSLAPASCQVGAVRPHVLNLTTTDEIDHFVHDFVFADESKRKEMISDP